MPVGSAEIIYAIFQHYLEYLFFQIDLDGQFVHHHETLDQQADIVNLSDGVTPIARLQNRT